jgi:hypothetical protein
MKEYTLRKTQHEISRRVFVGHLRITHTLKPSVAFFSSAIKFSRMPRRKFAVRETPRGILPVKFWGSKSRKAFGRETHASVHRFRDPISSPWDKRPAATAILQQNNYNDYQSCNQISRKRDSQSRAFHASERRRLTFGPRKQKYPTINNREPPKTNHPVSCRRRPGLRPDLREKRRETDHRSQSQAVKHPASCDLHTQQTRRPLKCLAETKAGI